MFNHIILNRFKNLKNVGLIKNANGTGEAESNFGDIVRIYIETENSIIIDANFKVFGGVELTVLTDLVCDYIKNKNVEELNNINEDDLLNLLKIDMSKYYLLDLIKIALQDLYKDYLKKIEKEK